MNELTENRLRAFLQGFRQKDVIRDIEKTVLDVTGGYINLCFLRTDKENLNLFVNLKNKLSFDEEISLTHVIQQKIGYDSTIDGDEIIIHFSSVFDEGQEKKLYQDIVALTEKNFENGTIDKFLAKNYPKFFKDLTGVDNSVPKLSDDVLSFLRSNPVLWTKLTEKSDDWDQVQQKVGSEIKKNSPTKDDGNKSTLVN
jgi:hypothetical protein